jgi:inorganic pyrophosphatase
MILWKDITPGPEIPEIVHAIIECKKGEQNKYELSKKANVLVLDRVLHSSVTYPHNYGLIPSTFAKDGDPLDILVLTTKPIEPLTVIEARPIGVLIMEDEKGIDEKILAVAQYDPVYRDYQDIVQLPQHILHEIKEFFRTYKNLEYGTTEKDKPFVKGLQWKGRDAAHMAIEQCIASFQEKYGQLGSLDPF